MKLILVPVDEKTRKCNLRAMRRAITKNTVLVSNTRVKVSQLVNKMYSYCLFPVVDKPRTSCYHLVTRLMRPTDSQQVVPTSLISFAPNKLTS